jgi:hypothetical protein
MPRIDLDQDYQRRSDGGLPCVVELASNGRLDPGLTRPRAAQQRHIRHEIGLSVTLLLVRSIWRLADLRATSLEAQLARLRLLSLLNATQSEEDAASLGWVSRLTTAGLRDLRRETPD